MAGPRTELSERLHAICDEVYFQPPTGTKLTYPCIVYSLDNLDINYADDRLYTHYNQYSITYITQDPDDSNVWRFLDIPYCSFNRRDVTDNLYHNYYRVFY